MNTIAIAVRFQVQVSWPKLATLKAMAHYEVARLKRKVSNAVERAALARIVDRVAMAFNPMPAMA